MLIKESVSATEEKRIVLGLIVSTDFIEAIKPIFKFDYFTNSYLQTLAMWCDSFYEEYDKAPFNHIKDIFQAESHRLKDSQVELIEHLLKDLDDTYDEGSINLKYWVDSAKDYFRLREVEIVTNNISVHKNNGDIAAAEEELKNFQRVTFEIDSKVLINPGDLEQQEEIYEERDKIDRNFFTLPGDLGRYLGNQKRGDVVGYFGPAKKGKTFTLINQWKHGIIRKRKSLFFSIEMTRTEVLPRMNKAFFPMIGQLQENEVMGMHRFPVFDCVHNQLGECADRLSDVVLFQNDLYIDDPAHTVCTKCKGSFDKEEAKKYKYAIYQDRMIFEEDDIFTMRKNHAKYKKMWDKYGRISVHKKYSLTYDKMMRDIEILWKKYKWFPDIILLDYIDILDIGSKFDDYREDDEKWKLIAKIAGETNTLFITATQANKLGHTTDILDVTHQGGFYGKNRHVNLMVGLNQNPEDKAQGIMKFGITEARDHQFIQGQTCTVLQDFATGQAYLDSYYLR